MNVWITGCGGVTGHGDEGQTRTAWLAGRTAVRPFDGEAAGLPPGYGAQTPFGQKELRALPGGRGLRPGTMTDFTFLACGAVGRALRNAAIETPEADAPELQSRRGISLGSYTNFPALKKHVGLVHAIASPDAARDGRYEIDDARVGPSMKGFTGFDFLQLMNNMPTAHVSIQAGARGPANTFLGHATSGLLAIARAADAIRLGLADEMLAGGTGPGTSEGVALLRHGAGQLAPPLIDPAVAARPFDRGARGLVPGDGAAAFLLEREGQSARRRIARIAAAEDRFATPRTPRGPLGTSAPIEAALRDTLRAADWTPESVDLLAASGCGLPELDAEEATAIAAVFTPATALSVHTGVTGFCDGAHGALGLLFALQAIDDGSVPPQVGLVDPWPALAPFQTAGPVSRRLRRAVVLGVAPEGQIVAVAVEAA